MMNELQSQPGAWSFSDLLPMFIDDRRGGTPTPSPGVTKESIDSSPINTLINQLLTKM